MPRIGVLYQARRTNLGRAAGQGCRIRWPQISLHRGTLQQILLDAFLDRVGADYLHLGMHLTEFSQVERGVRAQYTSRGGDRSECSIDGRLLIARDGIHSVARKSLYPSEGLPNWNGAVMWRGVAESEPILDGATMIMAGHQEAKFVCYPILPVNPNTGTQLTNFIAERRFQSTTLTEREDWNRQGSFDDFLPFFKSFRFEWLDVPQLIMKSERVWTYPMIDRDPLPKWTFGSMTLLGDAAHPMYPIGSNGASQAFSMHVC